jgi:conjugal transfer/entry exclusion protein
MDTVVDPANLIDNILAFVQRLDDYSEQIDQSDLIDAQYMQMVEDYRQTLIEYDHYLHQLEGIAQYISDEDWDRLLEVLDGYYGRSTLSSIPPMDPDDPGYEDNLDNVLGYYGYVPRDPVEVQADVGPMGLWTPQYEREVEEDYNNFDLMKDKMRMVSENVKKSEARKVSIEDYAERVKNLGDESDLATLQLIAMQNVTLMKQQEDLVQVLNQQLMNQEMAKAERAAKKAKARDAEIERLKNRKPTALLGRDRWGDW